MFRTLSCALQQPSDTARNMFYYICVRYSTKFCLAACSKPMQSHNYNRSLPLWLQFWLPHVLLGKPTRLLHYQRWLPLAPTPAPTLKMESLSSEMLIFSFLLHVGSHWLPPRLPFVFEEALHETLLLKCRPVSYYNTK